jgi:2-iminobutanoate/2-iminopropanoate deaminase
MIFSPTRLDDEILTFLITPFNMTVKYHKSIEESPVTKSSALPADKIAHNPATLAQPKGVWSTVVTHPGTGLVFVSGLTSRNSAGEVVGVGDIGAQTEQVMTNMKLALEAAGTDLSRVLVVTVFVCQIDSFDEIHRVRRKYFPQEPPASTMVEVTRLVDDRLLIEINAIAALPPTTR